MQLGQLPVAACETHHARSCLSDSTSYAFWISWKTPCASSILCWFLSAEQQAAGVEHEPAATSLLL